MKRRNLKGIRIKKDANLNKLIKYTAAALFIIITLVITYVPGMPSWDEIYAAVGLREKTVLDVDLKDVTVTFLDVGQGDCIFIYSENTSILIDTGPSGNGKKIKSLLNSFGVDELDYLIITHNHDDHEGSLSEVRNLIKIKNEIIPTSTTKMSGMSLTLSANDDSDFTLDFLAPIYANDDLNNMSLVIKLTYKESSFLLMGDASFDEESTLLRTYKNGELNADVLKVGHHGSESSSSVDFLNTVKPSYAVISVGVDNDYGHPHRVTLQNLENVGANILRTDEDGTILFTTNGKDLKMHYIK